MMASSTSSSSSSALSPLSWASSTNGNHPTPTVPGNRATLQGLLKLRSKWEELFLTWGIFIVADYLFQFPLEWFVFAVYNATVIYRAFVTRATLFMFFMAIAVVADIAATFLLTPDQILLVTNIVIYGYLVGAIVGLSEYSLLVWFLFCLNDIFVRTIPASPSLLPLALYCFSFGSMMSAYALLVKVANHVHKNKEKDREKTGDKERDKDKDRTTTASAEGATASSSGSPPRRISPANSFHDPSKEVSGAASTPSPKDGRQTQAGDDVAASPEGVPESESTSDVISRLIQSLKKEQESRKAIETENRKFHQDSTKQIKALKGEILTLKDTANHLDAENKRLTESSRLLAEEKLKLTKDHSRLEDQVKHLTKEGKRMETLKARNEEAVKQLLSAKPQQDMLKEEQEKREKLERELENATEELAEERRRAKKIDGEVAALGSSNRVLTKEIEETKRQLEKRTLELNELHEDQVEVEELRRQLAKAISDIKEKNESLSALTQLVSHLKEKAESFEATLRDETRFKMDLMSELGRSRRELDALYVINSQLQSRKE